MAVAGVEEYKRPAGEIVKSKLVEVTVFRREVVRQMNWGRMPAQCRVKYALLVIGTSEVELPDPLAGEESDTASVTHRFTLIRSILLHCLRNRQPTRGRGCSRSSSSLLKAPRPRCVFFAAVVRRRASGVVAIVSTTKPPPFDSAHGRRQALG